jgi:hypothetical protein
MDYNDLQQQVENYKVKLREKRKEQYHYAREKGFSTKEAMILAGKSKEDIDKLALDRDSGKVTDGA